jgi:hypothetical protein
MKINEDAFSSGQIGSKIWLCEELENLFDSIDNIFIFGGWYGITAFLLRVRDRIKIGTIRSFDIDPNCESIADMINEYWVWQNWHFKAITEDCNAVTVGNVDLVINTSTEHFESMEWFDHIPSGTVVALQGNNMPHEDHCIHTDTLEQFLDRYPLSHIFYQGEKQFTYPNWKFTRYMLIGKK